MPNERETRAVLRKAIGRSELPSGTDTCHRKRVAKSSYRDEPQPVRCAKHEGFASGRVRRKPRSTPPRVTPCFPKDPPNGEIRTERVRKMFDKVVYAGYIEAPTWGITRRKAQHEALISLETWERIQERRKGNTYLPARADISKDFVLRGAVCCTSCDKPYRAAWTQGAYKKYAYYVCQNKACADYSQSIDRDRIEGEFADILQTMQPSKSLSDMIRAMFKKAWHAQSARAEEQSRHYQTELADTEKEINQLLNRIVDASSPRVVQAYEKRIDELEDKKLLLAEKIDQNRCAKTQL